MRLLVGELTSYRILLYVFLLSLLDILVAR